MGQVPPVGAIRFRGERIDGMKPHEIARRGLGYVPEGREIFPTLTVRENLLLGMKSARREGRWSLDDMLGLFRCCAIGSTRQEACCRAASSRC